LIHKIDKVPHD